MTPIPDAVAGKQTLDFHDPLNDLATKVFENSNRALRQMIRASEMPNQSESEAMTKLALDDWEEGVIEITGGIK